ncbi:atl2, partial [Symbiodinium sp. CCMP2456]
PGFCSKQNASVHQPVGGNMITNAAGQAEEDDFDGDLDQDPDLITEVDTARQRIKQLTHEQ